MFYFYATGVTPAMEAKMVGRGSQYAWRLRRLPKAIRWTAARTTGCTCRPMSRCKDFWSVILYNNQTRSMLQTDQQCPSVSSQTKGLLVNADGSVDV